MIQRFDHLTSEHERSNSSIKDTVSLKNPQTMRSFKKMSKIDLSRLPIGDVKCIRTTSKDYFNHSSRRSKFKCSPRREHGHQSVEQTPRISRYCPIQCGQELSDTENQLVLAYLRWDQSQYHLVQVASLLPLFRKFESLFTT